jgi:hypothetical protein
MTTDAQRVQSRQWAVGLAASTAIVLALGAIGAAQGFRWTGWIVAAGLAVILLCVIARMWALSNADASGPVSRLWGGAFDERDRRVLDGALAQVGAAALMALGIGNVLVSVGAATAVVVLRVVLLLLIALGVAAFAVIHARR